VKVGFLTVDIFGLSAFSYMPLNVCWFSELSFQLGTPSMRYECHLDSVWKLNFFLFNIEVYGEFFSGITPLKLRHVDCLAFKKLQITQVLWK
jgi:hypothetical protein